MKFLTFKNLWWIHIIILLRIANWRLYIFLHPFFVSPPSPPFETFPTQPLNSTPFVFQNLSNSIYVNQCYICHMKYMKHFIDKICTLNHSTLSILFTDPLISVPPSFSNASNLFIKSQLHPTANVYSTLHPITVTNATSLKCPLLTLSAQLLQFIYQAPPQYRLVS